MVESNKRISKYVLAHSLVLGQITCIVLYFNIELINYTVFGSKYWTKYIFTENENQSFKYYDSFSFWVLRKWKLEKSL